MARLWQIFGVFDFFQRVRVFYLEKNSWQIVKSQTFLGGRAWEAQCPWKLSLFENAPSEGFRLGGLKGTSWLQGRRIFIRALQTVLRRKGRMCFEMAFRNEMAGLCGGWFGRKLSWSKAELSEDWVFRVLSWAGAGWQNAVRLSEYTIRHSLNSH